MMMMMMAMTVFVAVASFTTVIALSHCRSFIHPLDHTHHTYLHPSIHPSVIRFARSVVRPCIRAAIYQLEHHNYNYYYYYYYSRHRRYHHRHRHHHHHHRQYHHHRHRHRHHHRHCTEDADKARKHGLDEFVTSVPGNFDHHDLFQVLQRLTLEHRLNDQFTSLVG